VFSRSAESFRTNPDSFCTSVETFSLKYKTIIVPLENILFIFPRLNIQEKGNL